MKKKILLVVAHPDDEVLGCGGTVARMIKEGYEACTLILGEGVTSRDGKRDAAGRRKAIRQLAMEAHTANRILGVREVIARGLPDNRFDMVPFLDVVKLIEQVKARIRPNIIFTHYYADLNRDHRITCAAAVTAARPICGETVKEMYSFEVLSSTEWNCSSVFTPDLFIDITKTLKNKVSAMRAYASEIKEYPHPRSLRGIEVGARYRGMASGLEYAEAFKTIRCIR